MRRILMGLLLAAAALLGGAPSAHAWLAAGADGTQPGRIAFHLWGSGAWERVDLSEVVGTTVEPLRTVVPPVVIAEGVQLNGAFYPAVTTWRCDRVIRRFVAVGHRADGTTETTETSLRTPSCRDRFALVAPRARQRRGTSAPVTVRDRWRLGDLPAQLCVRPPAARVTCSTPALTDGVARVPVPLPRRGHYRIALTTPEQTARAVVSSGVAPPADQVPLPRILTTGDSLMQSVDAALGDALTDRSGVRSDVRVGSGMSKDSGIPADWSRVPAEQARRFRPAATVVFLGTNEGWPMRTPAGNTVTCCGEPYVAEYARRVRRAMRTYIRGGRGAVVWINVPAAREGRRNEAGLAVNAAIARAATGLRRAAVLDADALFTPGRVYRDTMPIGGRDVRVREADGVHLTVAGATLVARRLVAELERLRVV